MTRQILARLAFLPFVVAGYVFIPRLADRAAGGSWAGTVVIVFISLLVLGIGSS